MCLLSPQTAWLNVESFCSLELELTFKPYKGVLPLCCYSTYVLLDSTLDNNLVPEVGQNVMLIKLP